MVGLKIGKAHIRVGNSVPRDQILHDIREGFTRKALVNPVNYAVQALVSRVVKRGIVA